MVWISSAATCREKYGSAVNDDITAGSAGIHRYSSQFRNSSGLSGLGGKVDISISTEEKLAYLTIMAGGGNKALYDVYAKSDDETRQKIIKAMGEGMQQLEPVMDEYGMGRDPEGVARGMVLTEDLIGCEPKGELLSVTAEEAVRKVTFCPWSALFSQDGGTCRLVMAAMEEGIGKKYGLEIICEQNMAEGAEYCIWKVRKKSND